MQFSRAPIAPSLVLLAAALTACSPTDEAPTRNCEALPLANPVLRIGDSDLPPGSALNAQGPITDLSPGADGSLTLDDAAHGAVTVHWKLPLRVGLDLVKGKVVKVDYRRTQGFEGEARGLRIRDDRGVVLLVDDGDYGNALTTEELAPFAISQKDAHCRNRKNEPGDLNNFLLVVSAGDSRVELIHGESGTIEHGGATYHVLCTRSTARVGDATWTDAPYEFRSFVIARKR